MVGVQGAVPLPGEHATDRGRPQSCWCTGTMHGHALPHLQPGDNGGAIPVSKGQSFPPSLFQEFMPGGNRSRRVIYMGRAGKGATLEREETTGGKNQLGAKQQRSQKGSREGEDEKPFQQFPVPCRGFSAIRQDIFLLG